MSQQPKHFRTVAPAFEQKFGGPPAIVSRGPGRVNLIGEHTDYNDGWVLPVAIPYEVNVAARPREDGQVRIFSLDLEEEATFSLEDRQQPEDLWIRYPQGVAIALQEAGHTLRGMDAVFMGDVPRGAGLSSSAAVELAFAQAYAAISGFSLPGPEAALAGRWAENEFVGVPTGIMDQFISALGKQDHALLLDCRTQEYRHIRINLPGAVLAVMDTGVRRELADSEYRERRADCEAAVEALRSALPDIRALRDVSPEELREHAGLLDEVQLKRARHVVGENARTLEAARALEAGNARRVGELMRASHESLRDDYEVSSLELDAVVEIADSTEGVIGARMTGAGFGGAAVALLEEAAVEPLKAALAAKYPARSGQEARVFVCRASDGASTLRLE